MQRKVLSIGHNLTRLRIRNAAIQDAGYQVVTTREGSLAIELARTQRFDAVIICSSIPMHLRENIVHELRRLRPPVPLIMLCEEHETEQCSKRLVDEMIVVGERESQEPLTGAIARIMARQGGN